MFCLMGIMLQAQIIEDDGRDTKLDSLTKIGLLPVVNDAEYLLTGDEGGIKRIPVMDTIPYPVVISAAADTTDQSATKPGDIYINTVTKDIYMSTGSGRGKYVLLNLFLPILLIIRRKRKCQRR